MARFGYTAVKEFGFLEKNQVIEIINYQWSEEWKKNGNVPRAGDIAVRKKYMTRHQVDTVIEAMLMEPNISWSEQTWFAQSLQTQKHYKQALGEHVGKWIKDQAKGNTVFLSNSSTIYYLFRGMVKHAADVNVLTIHAAILAVYPSLKSKIRSIRTIWKGQVDLDNALISPHDLGDPHTKTELDFLEGDATHAFISARGFDCKYGPMAVNETAREVSRRVLQGRTRPCIVIDHTRALVNIDKNDGRLLFDEKEWRQIRDRDDLKIFVTCHPKMPSDFAGMSPADRPRNEISKVMRSQNKSESTINEVLNYQHWAMCFRNNLSEIFVK